MRTAFILFLSFLLAACVESEVPLSAFAPLAPDHPLIGTWTVRNEKETVYLHIGNQEKTLHLLEVEIDHKGTLKSERYEAISTSLASGDYLSVPMRSGEKTTYQIWKYRVSGEGTLTFWPADNDFIADAINKGWIAGTVQPRTVIPKVLLTADQQSLQRFIAQHDAKIFIEPTTALFRINAAALPREATGAR
ncbi:MAG: hypothetical protein BWY57_01589 [Betaproteobacteria bacterium ADurb.Bin341]|nr:MAG: hypothetical protein BWY57_01589 [Betaproteobacteria bacterium ADurb.Bin341]